MREALHLLTQCPRELSIHKIHLLISFSQCIFNVKGITTPGTGTKPKLFPCKWSLMHPNSGSFTPCFQLLLFNFSKQTGKVMQRDINQILRYKSILIMECLLDSSRFLRNYFAKTYILLLIPAKPTHFRHFLLYLKSVALFLKSTFFPHVQKQSNKKVQKKTIFFLLKECKMHSAKSHGFQLKKLKNRDSSFKFSICLFFYMNLNV